jgi:ubiquinone/menaquinone biosynthesis C-methylase UbiE
MITYSFIEKTLKRLIIENSLVLEVGCGPGQYANFLNAKYVGLDKETKNIDPNMSTFVVGDGMFLPFRNEVFNMVFFVSSLYQMTDVKKAINEAYRVLKRESWILIFDYNKKTHQYLERKEKFGRFCWNSKDLSNILKMAGFSCRERHIPYELWFGNHIISCFFRGFCSPLIKLYDLRRGWNVVFGKKL